MNEKLAAYRLIDPLYGTIGTISFKQGGIVSNIGLTVGGGVSYEIRKSAPLLGEVHVHIGRLKQL